VGKRNTGKAKSGKKPEKNSFKIGATRYLRGGKRKVRGGKKLPHEGWVILSAGIGKAVKRKPNIKRFSEAEGKTLKKFKNKTTASAEKIEESSTGRS